MYTNNLILDLNNTINIRQNENNFFDIKANILFENSIQIHIRPFEYIDTVNLYLIIKSYINNLQYVVSSFLIVIENEDEKNFVANNISINEFKNLTFYGFVDWLYHQLHRDWKYMNLESNYYLVFTYKIKIFNFDNIKFLKPKYPWDSHLLEKFSKLKINEEYYIKTIDQLKQELDLTIKKNKELLNEIDMLKKKGN